MLREVSDFNASAQEARLVPCSAARRALGFWRGRCSSGRGADSPFPADGRENTRCCCRQLATTHDFLRNMFLRLDFGVTPLLRNAEGVAGWQDGCFARGSRAGFTPAAFRLLLICHLPMACELLALGAFEQSPTTGV